MGAIDNLYNSIRDKQTTGASSVGGSAIDNLYNSIGQPTKEAVDQNVDKAAPINIPPRDSAWDKTKKIGEKVGKGILNFFTGFSQELGKTYGAALSTKDKEVLKNRQDVYNLANKQYKTYLNLAKKTQNKNKKKKYLLAAKKAADISGFDVFNDKEYQKTAKQIAGESLGAFLETATLGSYGGAVKSFKYITKLPKVAESLGLKGLAKLSTAEATKKILVNAAKDSVKVGLPLGVGFGLSSSLSQNKKVKQNINDALISGLAGTALQFGIGTVLGSISRKLAIRKLNKIENNESIQNKIDASIKYIFKPLGKNDNGDKILGRSEFNYKTGEATILLDPSLKKNPETLTAIIEHEHGHILDKRMNAGKNISAELPNYEGNKESLDNALGDFAQKQNKPVVQVANELNYDIQRVGNGENNAEKFADAFSKYKENPNKFKQEAPALADYFSENERYIKAKEIKTQQEKIIPKETQVAEKPKTKKVPARKGTRSSGVIAGTGLKTGKRVKTKGFNPSKINAPEEVEQLFGDLEGAKINKNRLSKTNQDIKDLAHLTGLTEEQLIKAKPGSIANSETTTKARQLVLDKAQDLLNYLKGIKASTATDKELQTLKDKWLKLVSMQRAVAGLRTEAAHTFRSLGIELMPGENATLRELGTKLEKLGAASKGDLSLFSHKVGKDIKLSKLEKLGGRALSTWYAAILSGPKTTARNIISTMGNIMTEYFSKFGNPKEWKEIIPATKGMFKGLIEALPESKLALKGERKLTGKFMESGGQNEKLFASKYRAVRTYGKIVDSVGRFLNAQDVAMKGIATGMEKASLKARKLDLTEPLGKAIIDSYSERSVYHGKPTGRKTGAIVSATKMLRKKFPESKIIIPFVDTVANVIDRQFDYIPIFSQLRLKNSVLERRAEQIIKDYGLKASDKKIIISRLRDQQIGRMMLGLAATAGATKLAMDGKISGIGPSSYARKKQLEKSGWRANSIKIGNKWYPYINWGPLAGILSIAGNIHDKTVYDKSPTKTLSDLISKGIIGWMQTEMDTSFLSGVSNLFGVVSGDYPANSYFKNLISGLVPIPAAYTQTKDIYKYINGQNYVYSTNSIGDKIQKKLLLNPNLPIKKDAFGNPVKSDLIYGMSPSKVIKDPVIDYLNKNQFVIGIPFRHSSYTIHKGLKREMTQDEYNQYITESGKRIYERLNKTLPLFKRMKPEDAKTLIKKIVSRERQYVRRKILNK